MSHLHLVRPADEKPRKVRGAHWRIHLFTPDEENRLREALRSLRWLYGTWACAADALRVPQRTLEHAARGQARVSASLAVRLSKALEKPLESLYRPPSDALTCPHCGAKRAP